MLYNATCLLNYYRDKLCDFNFSHDIPKTLYNKYKNESGCFYPISQPLITLPNFKIRENYSIYNLSDNFSVSGLIHNPLLLKPEKLYQLSCSQITSCTLACNIYNEKYIGAVSLYYDRLPPIIPYVYGHIHNNNFVNFKLYSKDAIQSKPRFIKRLKSIEIKLVGNSVFINNDISFKLEKNILRYLTINISCISNTRNSINYEPRLVITFDGETQQQHTLDFMKNNYSFSFNNRHVVEISDKNVISIGRNISIKFEHQEMLQNGYLAQLSIINVPGESIYNKDGSMDHQIHLPQFHQLLKFKNTRDLMIEDANTISISPNYCLIEPIYFSFN